jgi:hypothetical protein
MLLLTNVKKIYARGRQEGCLQRKEMYKEAQATPSPLPIGGIIAVCGSRSHDFRLLGFSPPPPSFSWGGKFLFYEDFFISF